MATYEKMLDKVLGVDIHVKTKVVRRDTVRNDKPKVIKPTHDIPVCHVSFWSFQLHRMDYYMKFCRKAAYYMGIPCSGAIAMPKVTRRWTVLKSPFVHKAAMEVFERHTHKRVIFVKDANPEVVKKWLEYINLNIPVGVGMKYRMHEYEPLNIGDEIVRGLVHGKSQTIDTKEIKKTKYLQHVVQRGRRRLMTTYKDLPVYKQSDIADMAGRIITSLKSTPGANIEQITRDVVAATRGAKEKRSLRWMTPRQKQKLQNRSRKHLASYRKYLARSRRRIEGLLSAARQIKADENKPVTETEKSSEQDKTDTK
ncbi:mitochondrial 37S ribosomal protein rsm10 [Coemansia guatemalensis]|uniref:Mitochondrial 37S ribosomal protein rsm10 n=1 Tax=Coemansia guatemalensis TaxID=2761395 RepID=A0A9W8I178_9FUNG|nr:mitochondrial 37S ribosomal protein rsm10 [Coemansia guatemalensis]